MQNNTQEKTWELLASTIQFSNHHAPTARKPTGTRPEARRKGRTAPGTNLGWRSGNPKACPYHIINGCFHTSIPDEPGPSRTRGSHRTPDSVLYSP